jgi:hypothetical protein
MFELLHYKQQYICCGLFYDSVSILGYVLSNGRVIHKNELKEFGRKQP